MKLLLINAINKSRNIESSFPHLGFAYIASYLEKFFGDSCEIKVVDDDIEASLQSFQPDIVGVSSVSQNFNLAKQLCALAKNHGVFTIVGGVHITMLPDSLDENMDCGVIGEGEATMLEVARAFEKHKRITPDVLGDIAGLVYRDSGGAIQLTPKRQVLKPLDQLPMPKRELLNIKRNDSTSIFSSRGCPYDCVFCASARFWPKVRLFSAEYVINEIRRVIDQYQPKFISFKDDLFIANKDRLGKIAEYVNKEGLNKRVGFFVSCRANLVDRETAGLLKKMNVVHASMGLESGCERTLTFLKGGNVTPEQGLAAVRYLSEENIHVNAAFIIGSPTETKDEILHTLNYIKKSNLSSLLTYVMIPFPGTPIWDYALKRGLVSVDMDWSRLSVDFANSDSKPIILSETLSQGELYELYMLFKKEERKRLNAVHFKKLFTSPFTVMKSIIWKKIK